MFYYYSRDDNWIEWKSNAMYVKFAYTFIGLTKGLTVQN